MVLARSLSLRWTMLRPSWTRRTTLSAVPAAPKAAAAPQIDATRVRTSAPMADPRAETAESRPRVTVAIVGSGAPTCRR